MSKDKQAILGCFSLIVLAFVGVVFSGYVISTLWSWFVVNLFDIPALSIPYAIGLTSLVSMFQPITKPEKNESDDVFKIVAEAWAKVLFKPALALLIGWITYQFV